MRTSSTPEHDGSGDTEHDAGVETFRLAVIIGSVRPCEHDAMVADWFIRQVERRTEPDPDVIDLAEVDLPFGFGAGTPPDHVPGIVTGCTVRRRVDAADACVVVAPDALPLPDALPRSPKRRSYAA